MKVHKLCRHIFFVFFGLFIFVKSSCPIGGGNPQTAADCYNNTLSSSANLCCMISSPGYNATSKMCLELTNSSYVGQNLYSYNNLTWNLDCGSVKVSPIAGGPCGNANPVFGYDCWAFSTMDSSCCLYKPNNTLVPSCQWLGTKKMGNATLKDYTLLCSSKILILNSLVLAFIILILFLY